MTEIAIDSQHGVNQPHLVAVPQPKLHVMKPREPKTGSGEAAGGQAAPLIVAVFGAMYLAYVFNFSGFETGIDAYFEGLDMAVKSHNSQVARMLLIAAPFAGGLLASTFLWAFVTTVTRVTGIAPPTTQKTKLQQQRVSAEPDAAGLGKKPVQKATAVCVKPLRLDRRDPGVAKVILTRR